MGEELNILMSSPKATLMLLMAPSMLTGILLIVLAYRLVRTLGVRFLDTQDRQAAAFEKIADGVERIKNDMENSMRFNGDIRVTMAAIAEKINKIYDNTVK